VAILSQQVGPTLSNNSQLTTKWHHCALRSPVSNYTSYIIYGLPLISYSQSKVERKWLYCHNK